ncbi:hypothetical protein C0991_009540 [Blastosporella zonata]|nr:hypothetical protein C0991_009540 [Blastosporella zonata]
MNVVHTYSNDRRSTDRKQPGFPIWLQQLLELKTKIPVKRLAETLVPSLSPMFPALFYIEEKRDAGKGRRSNASVRTHVMPQRKILAGTLIVLEGSARLGSFAVATPPPAPTQRKLKRAHEPPPPPETLVEPEVPTERALRAAKRRRLSGPAPCDSAPTLSLGSIAMPGSPASPLRKSNPLVRMRSPLSSTPPPSPAKRKENQIQTATLRRSPRTSVSGSGPSTNENPAARRPRASSSATPSVTATSKDATNTSPRKRSPAKRGAHATPPIPTPPLPALTLTTTIDTLTPRRISPRRHQPPPVSVLSKRKRAPAFSVHVDGEVSLSAEASSSSAIGKGKARGKPKTKGRASDQELDVFMDVDEEIISPIPILTPSPAPMEDPKSVPLNPHLQAEETFIPTLPLPPLLPQNASQHVHPHAHPELHIDIPPPPYERGQYEHGRREHQRGELLPQDYAYPYPYEVQHQAPPQTQYQPHVEHGLQSQVLQLHQHQHQGMQLQQHHQSPQHGQQQSSQYQQPQYQQATQQQQQQQQQQQSQHQQQHVQEQQASRHTRDSFMLWKTACRLRVEYLQRRYTPLTIRDLVAQEAAEYFLKHGYPKPWNAVRARRASSSSASSSASAVSPDPARNHPSDSEIELDGSLGARVRDDDGEDWSDYESELSDEDSEDLEFDEGDGDATIVEGCDRDPSDAEVRPCKRPRLSSTVTAALESHASSSCASTSSSIPTPLPKERDAERPHQEDDDSDDPDAEGDLDPDAYAHDPSFNAELSSLAPRTKTRVRGAETGCMSAFYVPLDGGYTQSPPPLEREGGVVDYETDGEGEGEYRGYGREGERSRDVPPHLNATPVPPLPTITPDSTPTNGSAGTPPPTPTSFRPSFRASSPYPYNTTLPVPPPRLATIPVLSLRQAETGTVGLIGRGTPVDRGRKAVWGWGMRPPTPSAGGSSVASPFPTLAAGADVSSGRVGDLRRGRSRERERGVGIRRAGRATGGGTPGARREDPDPMVWDAFFESLKRDGEPSSSPEIQAPLPPPMLSSSPSPDILPSPLPSLSSPMPMLDIPQSTPQQSLDLMGMNMMPMGVNMNMNMNINMSMNMGMGMGGMFSLPPSPPPASAFAPSPVPTPSPIASPTQPVLGLGTIPALGPTPTSAPPPTPTSPPSPADFEMFNVGFGVGVGVGLGMAVGVGVGSGWMAPPPSPVSPPGSPVMDMGMGFGMGGSMGGFGSGMGSVGVGGMGAGAGGVGTQEAFEQPSTSTLSFALG